MTILKTVNCPVDKNLNDSTAVLMEKKLLDKPAEQEQPLKSKLNPEPSLFEEVRSSQNVLTRCKTQISPYKHTHSHTHFTVLWRLACLVTGLRAVSHLWELI